MKSTPLFFLFLFHVLISWFTYNFVIENPSDSTLYWLLNYDVHEYKWLDFFKVGTPFMVFLNYPLLKLGVPFWMGHVLYSIIGFFGIYLFAKWAFAVLNVKSNSLLIAVLLAFILLSPNLHIWTSFIGKESVVFWSISVLFYSSLNLKARWYLGAIGLFLLVMIRPHVAFMLLTSAFIVVLLDRSLSNKLRGLVLGGAISVGSGLFFLMLKISNIRYLDWGRIQHFNVFSVLSLKDTTGYVPMLEYSYVYKVFSLNFRPLFYDAYSKITFLASIENAVSLIFIALGLVLVFKNFKTLVFKSWMKVSFLFFIIASVLYVERYSNLGLFMRTKMMYMPFVLVVVTSIISQSLSYKSSSKKLIRLTTVPMSLQFLIKGQPRFMSALFEVLCISSGPKKELQKVATYEKNTKVKEVQMTREITPFQDMISLIQLIKVFLKEKPIIVHSHTPKAGILGMLAAKLADVPIRLHTVAGMPLMEATGLKRKILDAVEKLTYTCATKVYPNSKALEKFIRQNNYAPTKKVKVIANGSSNGIDTSYFNPENHTQQQNQDLRKQLGIQEKDFVFIFVGRLVGDKGINELVHAFKTICSDDTEKNIETSENIASSLFRVSNEARSLSIRPSEYAEFRSLSDSDNNRNCIVVNPQTRQLRLLLVGPQESELDPLLPETLQEIESNPNIITTGFQADVRPYFAIANALAFPSYREGFPNVVMQAGAMGLPSIVSDINGCNEIINEGNNGLIVPPKDTEALQTAMKRLLEDQDLYQQLKNNAREMITSRYEQKLVWEALLEEYESLLKEKGIENKIQK